jgi:hypothetical protein
MLLSAPLSGRRLVVHESSRKAAGERGLRRAFVTGLLAACIGLPLRLSFTYIHNIHTVTQFCARNSVLSHTGNVATM